MGNGWREDVGNKVCSQLICLDVHGGGTSVLLCFGSLVRLPSPLPASQTYSFPTVSLGIINVLDPGQLSSSPNSSDISSYIHSDSPLRFLWACCYGNSVTGFKTLGKMPKGLKLIPDPK